MGWEEGLLPMPMGSKRRAAGALSLLLPAALFAALAAPFLPALEIAAARDLAMALRLSALYFRLFLI